MSKKYKRYTDIGRRIGALGRNQRDIARVLGLSQQTVSKKLRGECAILLSDLETLGKAYRIPLTYFFEEDPGSPELARALRLARTKPGPLRDLVVLASRLRTADRGKLLRQVRGLGR